ncbi:vanadium-dependent haloperoxidase [Chryseolinea sp. T2]|uniref:vanadium-dependent haloperoxidase n=1 Tax=Chryseolinea sp. T2 TaxID=3129255 RepID=UPI003077C4B7
MKKQILAIALLSGASFIGPSHFSLGQSSTKDGGKKGSTRASEALTAHQQHLKLLNDDVFSLSEVMLHDVANPPAASRFYAYSLLGAYEAIYYAKATVPDINIRLKANPITNTPVPPAQPDLSFCANYTMLQVGKQIMPSGPMLEERQKALTETFRKKYKMSKGSLDEHIRYCQEVASQVMQYARKDAYSKLSTYKRYTPSKEEGHWYPTPPEYMAAVEPQWKTIRPFFLDSASQFKPDRPAAFSKDTTSSFYRQLKEVYITGKNLTTEQRNIASFWDCNPFAVTYSGHMAYGLKKISPGGHWMAIAGIACYKANISLDSAVLVHALVALTLHDAFISCWQEKYTSDRIRPEAAINKLMDPSWRPLLQTPPFPEYTSGHSVVSSAVSVVLTHLFGDNFAYTDNSELYFGLPEREFKSFYQAADEAAISRLYGGIHYRDACENGVKQGRNIGRFVLSSMFVQQGH